MLVFEEWENRSTRRKPLGAEQRTNKLNPHITPDLGIEPGPHWLEASALTTTTSTIQKTEFLLSVAKMARLPKGLIPKSTNLPQIAIILIQAFIHGLKKKKKNRSSMPRFDEASATLGNFPATLLVILLRNKLQGCRCSTQQLKTFFLFAALRDTLPEVELISTSRNSGGNKNVAPHVCGWIRYTGQFIMRLISQQNCKTCCRE